MSEQEDQFRAIALGELQQNEEFQCASKAAAIAIATCFGMLKHYGIESATGLVFVCDAGEKVATVMAEPHLREHLR